LLIKKLRLPRIDLEKTEGESDADVLRVIPHDFANARRVLPLDIDRSLDRPRIRVAMADPLDYDAVEEIEVATVCSVDPLVARSDELGAALHKRYRGVITKLIPRSDSPASPQLQMQALVELLVEKQVLPRGAYEEALAKLLRSVG